MGVLRRIVKDQSEVPIDEATEVVEKISDCVNEVNSNPLNDLGRTGEAYCCTSPTENNNNSDNTCIPSSQEVIHENNNAESERRELHSPKKLISQNRGDSNDLIQRSIQSYDISTLKEAEYNKSKRTDVSNQLSQKNFPSEITGDEGAIPSFAKEENKHEDNVPQTLTRAAEILETMKSGNCSVCNTNLCLENVDKEQASNEKSRELLEDSSSDEEEEADNKKGEETTTTKEISPVPPSEETPCPTAPDGDTQVGEVKLETNGEDSNKESGNPAEGEENAVALAEEIEKIEVTTESAAAVEKSNQSLRDDPPNLKGDEINETGNEEAPPSDEVGKIESPEAEKTEEGNTKPEEGNTIEPVS